MITTNYREVQEPYLLFKWLQTILLLIFLLLLSVAKRPVNGNKQCTFFSDLVFCVIFLHTCNKNRQISKYNRLACVESEMVPYLKTLHILYIQHTVSEKFDVSHHDCVPTAYHDNQQQTSSWMYTEHNHLISRLRTVLLPRTTGLLYADIVMVVYQQHTIAN